jgi:hypothetical protein
MHKLVVFLAILTFSTFANSDLSDAQVKQQMINNSIVSYPGKCPCPYNVTSNGSRCGRRSAYSNPGGYSPFCYDADISQQMVIQYRERNNL